MSKPHKLGSHGKAGQKKIDTKKNRLGLELGGGGVISEGTTGPSSGRETGDRGWYETQRLSNRRERARVESGGERSSLLERGSMQLQHQSIELRSICEADFPTPLLLRDQSPLREDQRLAHHCSVAFFVDNEDCLSNPETIGGSLASVSAVSTIESPCSDDVSNYMTVVSSDEQEFNTDVSPTRKRRRKLRR